MALKEILYVSRVMQPLSDKDIEDILENARKKNDSNNITGALIYDGKSFMQILEGQADVVIALYKDILNDPRHEDIITISNETIDMRCFGAWSMDFKHKKIDDTDCNELGAFLDSATDSQEAANIARNVFFTEFNLSPQNRCRIKQP